MLLKKPSVYVIDAQAVANAKFFGPRGANIFIAWVEVKITHISKGIYIHNHEHAPDISSLLIQRKTLMRHALPTSIETKYVSYM